MLIATAIFLPLILAYTAVYSVFWGKVSEATVRKPVRWPTETLDIAAMWYIAWILGLGLATTVGILNALWYELRAARQTNGTSRHALTWTMLCSRTCWDSTGTRIDRR